MPLQERIFGLVPRTRAVNLGKNRSACAAGPSGALWEDQTRKLIAFNDRMMALAA